MFPVLRRWLRFAVAVLYSAWTLFYAISWMDAMHRIPNVELGFENSYLAPERAMRIDSVQPGSPAQRAGLRAGDRIVGVDNQPIDDEGSLTRVWLRHRAGDRIELTIRHPGELSPLKLVGTFRSRSPEQPLDSVSQALETSIPVPFVLVGLAVLLLRIDDPMAWLLALLFGGFIASPGFPDHYSILPPQLRPFASAYQALFLGSLGALFYTFFARFPTRSSIDRHLPWFKWVGLFIGLAIALPGLETGRLLFPAPLRRITGEKLSDGFPFWFILTLIVLGLVALGVNFLQSTDAGARRKIRVVFWGAVLGTAPALLRAAIQNSTGVFLPQWVNAAVSVILLLLPLSFAYAVVKHQVLEIPVLLRRSARYLLVQRGFTFLLSALSIALTLLFAFAIEHYLDPGATFTGPWGILLGALFGTGLLWTGSQIHRRVGSRIDRAFFRSAYDGRMILEDLAERTRTVTGREELARLLEGHLQRAMQPISIAIELDLPPGHDAAPPGDSGCRIAIPGLAGRSIGLLALGPRLSDEPYSREDKRLLESVASQAGTALENLRLAGEIADRMERERRSAREMDIAKDVQARLLPEAPPQIGTLTCAARCVQARSVGGDYYDFLDLGPGRTGLVLADISGKGVHAALLMANLQAHLRSQSAIAPHDPAGVLRAVNRSLWKSTAAQHFATLFFGIYDDASRRLEYVNCGHNPPVLLRHGGEIERLRATATVMGIFEAWNCTVSEIVLAPGDLLVIFSDGVPEAARGEEDFGEERMLAELRAAHGRPADQIVNTLLERVQEFSQGEQSDDLTLLIAMAR